MKKVLTRNVPLKILSFLLAVMLWVVVMNIDDPYVTRTIENISVTELNTNVLNELGKIYEVETGKSISVTVRGKRSDVEYLKSTDFVATADFKEMSEVKAVPIRVDVKESTKYNARDIQIIDQHDMMTLTLEEADAKTFRVEIKPTGQVKDGYYVVDKVANPNIIEISGSKKQISRIKEVIVEVSVEQADESFEIVTSPKALDENGYPVDDTKLEFQTKDIAINMTVLPTKEIGIIVSTKGTPYYGYSLVNIINEPKVITIAGTQEDLDKIGYVTIPCDITLRKENLQDTQFIETYIDTSKYTIVGESNGVAITAFIEKLDSKDIIIHSNRISFNNLNPEYEAIIHTPGTLTLHVMGPEGELSDVTADTLQPTIDLENYEPGTYSMTLNCTLSDNLTVRPVTISVEIKKKVLSQ